MCLEQNGKFCSCWPCAPTCRSMIWQLGTYLPSLCLQHAKVICPPLLAGGFNIFSPIFNLSQAEWSLGIRGCPGLQIGARNLRGDLQGHDVPVSKDGWKGKSTGNHWFYPKICRVTCKSSHHPILGWYDFSILNPT